MEFTIMQSTIMEYWYPIAWTTIRTINKITPGVFLKYYNSVEY